MFWTKVVDKDQHTHKMFDKFLSKIVLFMRWYGNMW